ncbi:PQQ-dependent sugar dehydrogenase [Flectobacillus roseus]|uniref:PQQ-dependent sugar dehydrogenase n=1 Tax=Flectobacillus roseus TaxID=502259 RepID=A0ABT6Y2G5_9BACT|nr:PQQ-dependent sugar dehydrogenase [Flectobacillus roseus]MDI9857744.1 PQQ-dependent sugar dehydrogenase [Flectobacillus roseus]
MKIFNLLSLNIILSLLSMTAFAQSGDKLYKNYCAGCHGTELQGSSAPALIRTSWKHGGDKASLIKTITQGIPTTEMIKWENTLNAREIESVADFIINAQQKPKKEKQYEESFIVETHLYKLKIERLVTKGLSTPWGIEFVDNHTALISEKSGELTWMKNGKLSDSSVKNTPPTYAQSILGGYMDIALDQDYAKNGWVYLALSHNSENSLDAKAAGMTKIVRGKIRENQWLEEQTLFQVHDSLQVKGGTRWGSRLALDKKGHLFFTIGDMNRGEDSQILTRPSGKVFRINTDGSIPKDNPFSGNRQFIQSIYAWGNRNAQGITIHPKTNVIYATEHGPKGGDELNIIKNGANYGWPLVTYGVDYSGKIISDKSEKEGIEKPLTQWTPSIAVSAIDFAFSAKFPKWKGNLIVGSLAFQELRRLVIDGDQVLEQEILLKGYGRIRDVKFAPDGSLYLLMNAPDQVLKITPMDE